LPHHQAPLRSEHTYSLIDAEKAIESMSKHFIICGNDRIARSAISRLDPTRPFVIISNDNTMTSELIKRGFRVVHGNPSSEETLMKAGVRRAQAIMVALDKKADSVLTVITSRSMNKRLLITTTANTDDMIEKLEMAGADRVVSPFHVAARFVLLTTTRPELSGYVSAVQDLAPDEWYMVEVTNLTLPDSHPMRGFTRRTAFRVPSTWRPTVEETHLFRWQVSIIVVTGEREDGSFIYTFGGNSSEPDFFSWLGHIPTPTPTPTYTPSPTPTQTSVPTQDG
jgi:voltage-gated potassium channel Kch